MSNRIRWPRRVFLGFFVSLFVGVGLVAAQRVTPSDLFRIELLKPEFETADFTFPTSALFVTLRQSVEGPVSVELKVPFAYVGEDDATGNEWEFRPGNPYFGLSWGSPSKPAELGFGLRAPILPDAARIRIMRISDIHEFEAFVPDLWNFAVYSNVGGAQDPAQAHSQLNLWIPTDGDVEVVADYSLTLRRLLVNLLVGAQVRGRAGLTGDNLVFGERFMHEAGVVFEFPTPGFRPGLVVRAPIQGREIVDWVIGLTAVFE